MRSLNEPPRKGSPHIEILTIFGKRHGDKIVVDSELGLLTVNMQTLGGMITVTCEFPRNGVNIKCEPVEPPTLDDLFHRDYPC